jgi:transglutaminase superfamily protein/tetratricopeptide repeat protein
VSRLARPALILVALLLVGGYAAVQRGLHHSLYRALFYTVVSDRVTRSATSPTQVVGQLNEFVYMNVRTPEDAPVVDDTAADTLIRGFSYCDSAVLLFTRLLQEQGITSRMTFLSEAEGAPSPHTIAEVFLEGAWRVFDTYYDFIPRQPDGSVASIADLVAHPELLGPSRSAVDWYRAARPVVESDPPREPWRTLHALMARLPDPLADRLQDVYLSLPPPTYLTRDRATLSFAGPDGQLYYRARNYHAFQRTAEATSAYQQLLREYPTSAFADDARYELGVLDLTQAHDPRGAAQQLQSLLNSDPATPWRDDATYLQARAYEASGECAPARQLYTQISQGESNGLEDARARLSTLACA